MTAADYGFRTPVGEDLISQGDNDISSNAERTAALFEQLRFARSRLSDPIDLHTVIAPGAYALPAPYPAGYTNTPEGADTAALMLVINSRDNSWCARLMFQYGQNPRMWWQVQRSLNNGTFSEWFEVGTGGASATVPPVSDSHGMRVQAFCDQYPLVSTGGLGVVVLRFDHGLTNFKSTLWPLLQQYNVRAYVPMNSRLWTIAENSGATQADAKAWIASGLVEFGNHTADHEDRDDDSGIYDNIVNGRRELEAQLGTTIHGFTVPGLTGSKFNGFGGGTLDSFSETYAGGLILANHAISSGTIGASQRTLDGQIRQGGRHYTWEAASWASIKAVIDSAVTNRTAVTLMAHPRTMNLSGYWTPALAEQVISYIRERIDAGDLADLSYYQSHRATTAAL